MRMWRVFVPAKSKDDLDILPAWFVSFDGEQFVEVIDKPDASKVSLMHTAWEVSVHGHTRRRDPTEFPGGFVVGRAFLGDAQVEQVAV